MGIFSKWKQKKAEQEAQELIGALVNSALRDAEEAKTEAERTYWRLWSEAQADTQYQENLKLFYDLVSRVREQYAVLNALNAFGSEDGNKFIDFCAEVLNFDIALKPKRDYYENSNFDLSEAAKTLAMVFEKRGEYGNAAAVCMLAIENGFTADGTNGGMRGRLARMIKKGNLPITEEMREKLNISGE